MASKSKERPIIFSAPMVRAILDGRKTQTRRALKSQPPADHGSLLVDEIYPVVIDRWGDDQPGAARYGVTTNDGDWCLPCPYGQPGDRLWVRETTIITPKHWNNGEDATHKDADGDARIVQYLATQPNREGSDQYKLRATPSIFMPCWASRITLEITGVRVERLQDITEDDANAEGVTADFADKVLQMAEAMNQREPRPFASAYETLWESINGHDSWAANPWVWVIEFKRLDQ